MRHLTLLMLLTGTTVFCNAQVDPYQVSYELEYTYDEKASKKTDSLYQVSLVIDEGELEKLKRFYIKVGSAPEQSDLFVTAISKETLEKKEYDIEKDKEKLLKRKGKNIQIDLGSYRPGDVFISVKSKDEENRYVKSKDLKKLK